MKFNFKKIAPILASAVLLGSTVGFASVMADLGTYPKPFVSGGKADVNIIYGADGVDGAAMELLSSDLSSELASQTATGATSTASVSGENVELGTSSTKIYYNSSIDSARTSLTKAELPTLLADGTFQDNSGNEYKYTQAIKLGKSKVAFGRSGSESIDPTLMLDVGYSAAECGIGGACYLYNYTLTFAKVVNTTSTTVQSRPIKILGTEYTIGSSSDDNTLVLFGAGTTVTVAEGEEKTVTVSGAEHTLELVGTDTATTGVILFDGVRKSITKGSSYKFANGVEVYAKDIFHQTKTGVASSGEFLVGSTKITLEANDYVKKGAEDTSFLGTECSITTGAAGSDGITSFSIAEAYAESLGDYLTVGGSFADRVFPNLKLEFTSVSPALDSTARDEVIVTGDSANAKVTFTSQESGTPFTFVFAHDQDNDASDATVRAKLSDANNKTIHVRENETIQVEEYMVINAGDRGRIVQLTHAGTGTDTTQYTEFKDAITGESWKFDTGINNYSSGTMGSGDLYYIKVNSPDLQRNVTVNWGTGATYNVPGDTEVIYPRIKLKGGGWIALLDEEMVMNTTSTNPEVNTDLFSARNSTIKIALPGLETLADYEAGLNLTALSANHGGQDGLGQTFDNRGWTFGRVNYTVQNSTPGGIAFPGDSSTYNFSIVGINMGEGTAEGGSADCNFTSPENVNTGMGPAILLLEPNKLGEVDGDAICVPLTTTGTNNVHIAIDTPKHTDLSDTGGTWDLTSMHSNSYKSQGLTIFGTWVERDITQGTDYKVTIKYPKEAMRSVLFVAETAAEATVTESASGVTKLGAISLSDAEAATQQPTTNLIVVGDSCVNSVALKLASTEAYETHKFCGAKLTELYGYAENEAIIKQFESPYSATKVAILVAGWEKEDTMAAAKFLRDKKAELVDLTEKKLSKGVDYQ